jgi:site-specific DNA recombinase
MTEEPVPVAVYLRVSSDDQRDRETIKTQREVIGRFLAQNPQYTAFRYYEDDGVSGTVPMALRPAGRQMVADAKAGKFFKIVVLRASRLGREEIDLLTTYNLFVDLLGIELIGVAEPLGDRTMFGFQSIMAGYARRQFLADSARGMERAAREGRYTGGIVPLGYRVDGRRQTARLIPDETIIWGDWTAADLVRRIYHWLGVEERSCRWIARELNLLGVPTSYDRDGRGVRGKRTQGLWRPGRIRNLVVNGVYKGTLLYGRRRSRNSKRTDLIPGAVPLLVPSELWEAAQRTLAANRICAKNTQKVYLLRSVIVCGVCGLHYGGTPGRDGISWYRCNGQLAERGRIEGRCPGKSVRSDWLEPIVWGDIEGWLRNPGDVLDEINLDQEQENQRAVIEAERITLEKAIEGLAEQRRRAIDLHVRSRIEDAELDGLLDEIDRERGLLEERLARIVDTEEEEPAPLDANLLERLRARLDSELDDTERNDIVRLLVRRIVIDTTVQEDGNKMLRIRIEYRFPTAVPLSSTGRGSWPLPA